MREPLPAERLTEIREMHADYQKRCGRLGGFACCSAHSVANAVPALLDEVERLRTELSVAFAPGMYLDIQKILDEALGTHEADGAGAGIVADITLLADRLRTAEAETERLRTEHATEVDQHRRDNIELRDRAAGYTAQIAELEAKAERLSDEHAILADQLRAAQAKLAAVRRAGDENHDLTGAETDECHPGCPGCLIAAALGEHEVG
ncbi:hypothetical protein ACFVH6_22195 [Spirillospora sp. NPDC127200]